VARRGAHGFRKLETVRGERETVLDLRSAHDADRPLLEGDYVRPASSDRYHLIARSSAAIQIPGEQLHYVVPVLSGSAVSQLG
jgi:hypothetical protein